MAVYRDHCSGYATENNYRKRFREEWQTISDLPRPGQANFVINNFIVVIDERIRGNQRVRNRDISDELNPSKEMVQTTSYKTS
ncbi:hypothetical protein TNIN_392051 [Trichonephila inaurata madagascariensis]|uniref:Uncharacterized protein n=1 Tax=Trichonephila inaurata madagascariensis TaxID=2747483 RepID=A0A8X6XDP4_9ARAC|nr:hypothetical protein TNIN_392051 [Trichonephila inaurata madagascariensis]